MDVAEPILCSQRLPVLKKETDVLKRPTHGLQNRNRIQYEPTTDGGDLFREYWIHEWDRQGYDMHEHINDIDQAVTRATELGYSDDVEKLQQLRQGGN